jgi:RNase P subunit RPR2
MTTGYCVKCREKVELGGEEEYVMKNGKKAVKGVCSQCGTKVFVILKPAKPDYW